MSHDLAIPPLDSPLWHRVADLAPRLRATVRVRYRGAGASLRHVLVDRLSGRHHVVDAAAWAVIAHLDGHTQLGDIWRTLHERGTRAPVLRRATDPVAPPVVLPTQQEVIDWLIALDQAGLLLCDKAPDISAVIQGQRHTEAQRRRAAAHPLSWRLPLKDPSAWLARLRGVSRGLFHPIVGLLWLGLLFFALMSAGMHAADLQAALAERLTQPRFLTLSWLAYPLIKTIHELGHALAVVRYGGEVHHVGVAFIYLIPSPYVDASAASGFSRRGPRMVVSAAGVMVELGLAAIGLLLWAALEPGLARDMALVTAFVGGVSTVLANANPLVRMDGYHFMTDWLDTPNLAQRSRRHALGWLRRRLLGRAPDPAGQAALRPRDRLLLPLYAPMSWVFSAVMGVSMALWLADLSPLIGALVGSLSLWALVVKPLWHGGRWLLWGQEAGSARPRALGLTLAGLGLVVAALAVPMPYATTVAGVAWVPEDAIVRASSDGFVRDVARQDHTQVTNGQPLLDIVDEQLPLQLTQIRTRRIEQDTLVYALQWQDPPRAQRAAVEGAQLSAQEVALQDRIDQLHISARRSGTLSWVKPTALLNSWVTRGEVLGHVLDQDRLTVRVAVPSDVWTDLPGQVRRVSVLGPDGHATPDEAQWTGRAEAPSHHLPTQALSAAAGGPIETDPDDKDGLRTLLPVVVTDVVVPTRTVRWLGQRVWVRFEHAPRPLGPRLWRTVQQTLLRHLTTNPLTSRTNGSLDAPPSLSATPVAPAPTPGVAP